MYAWRKDVRVVRTEIPLERAIAIGQATEAPDKFPDIRLDINESKHEVWIQHPPTPGRGRPSPYVLGLEFVIRGLAGMLEASLRNEARFAQSLRRAQDNATDADRIAQREITGLRKENEDLQKRILDLETQEAEHGRQMTAKEQALSERAGQVQDTQEQTRLREERHQETLDNLRKAHAEQLAGLRAEHERETDQLSEGHRQVVEAMGKDGEEARSELQELRASHEELKENCEALKSAKSIFEDAAQQSDTLLKVITAVSGFVSPVRYVLFVDDEGVVVEEQTYVTGEGDDADVALSNVYIHGEHIGITYEQGPLPCMIAYSMKPDGHIAVQEVPLDKQGIPTLAGLALLHFLKQTEVNPQNSTVRNFRDHPMFQRLTFGEHNGENTDETSEEDPENEEK